MLHSLGADIYPLRDPGLADAIDGALGDGSQFQLAYGYYAHGVDPETAKAPKGWQDRLVRREIPKRVAATRTAVAWCLEVHDLVLAKCAAGRERDWEYAAEALKAELVDPNVLLGRLPDLPVTVDQRGRIERMLRSSFATPRKAWSATVDSAAARRTLGASRAASKAWRPDRGRLWRSGQ